jgi:hypothetical protein
MDVFSGSRPPSPEPKSCLSEVLWPRRRADTRRPSKRFAVYAANTRSTSLRVPRVRSPVLRLAQEIAQRSDPGTAAAR